MQHRLTFEDAVQGEVNQQGALAHAGAAYDRAEFAGGQSTLGGLLEDAHGAALEDLGVHQLAFLLFSSWYFFTRSSCTEAGTWLYLENSMVNSALPWVELRSVVA